MSQGPNPSVNRTARKLRLRVPSALRVPVASYLKRSFLGLEHPPNGHRQTPQRQPSDGKKPHHHPPIDPALMGYFCGLYRFPISGVEA